MIAPMKLLEIVLLLLPTLIGGLLLALHDSATHTVLPAHMLAVFIAQIAWCCVACYPISNVHRSLKPALIALLAIWSISLLPHQPIGDGDALTTFLFTCALCLPLHTTQSDIIVIACWGFLTLLSAGAIIVLSTLQLRAIPTTIAFVPAQYAGFMWMLTLFLALALQSSPV